MKSTLQKSNSMDQLIKIEEIITSAFAVYLIWQLPIHPSVGFFILWFFAPDISMLGYLAGNKVGAISYNIFHHKGIAIFLWAGGIFMVNQQLQFIGLLLFAHSCFDRAMGYGLKFFQGFKFTHLGLIGKGGELTN